METKFQAKFDEINAAWERVFLSIEPNTTQETQRQIAINVFSEIMPKQITSTTSEFSHFDAETGLLRRLLSSGVVNNFFKHRKFVYHILQTEYKIERVVLGKERKRFVEFLPTGYNQRKFDSVLKHTEFGDFCRKNVGGVLVELEFSPSQNSRVKCLIRVDSKPSDWLETTTTGAEHIKAFFEKLPLIQKRIDSCRYKATFS